MRKTRLVYDYKRWYRFRSVQINAVNIAISAIQAISLVWQPVIPVAVYAILTMILSTAAIIARVLVQFPLPSNPPEPEEPTIPEAAREVLDGQ